MTRKPKQKTRMVMKFEFQVNDKESPIIIFCQADFKSFRVGLRWVKEKRIAIKKWQKTHHPKITRSSDIWIMENGRKAPDEAWITLIPNPNEIQITEIQDFMRYNRNSLKTR